MISEKNKQELDAVVLWAAIGGLLGLWFISVLGGIVGTVMGAVMAYRAYVN